MLGMVPNKFTHPQTDLKNIYNNNVRNSSILFI